MQIGQSSVVVSVPVHSYSLIDFRVMPSETTPAIVVIPADPFTPLSPVRPYLVDSDGVSEVWYRTTNKD